MCGNRDRREQSSVTRFWYNDANETSECWVLLDVMLTDELQKEGQMRELIRAIQDARKQWNLSLHEYIRSVLFQRMKQSNG